MTNEVHSFIQSPHLLTPCCLSPLSPGASYQPPVPVLLVQRTPLVAVDPLPVRVGLTQHL